MNNYLTFDTIVIGSGAAGYNAAARLKQFGVNVAIVTEGKSCGTSRNTGSDKQTYYKLSLGGGSPDSVRKMAEDLFKGGSVDGDNALCEAALSARCFMNLCELGVEFPQNRYGEYVGYKTDHDPFARATSAGPLTSKYMTEALEKRVTEQEISIFDGLLAVEIIKNENGVQGLLCLEKKSGNFVVFKANNVIMATGGPAAVYADTVYPNGHTGSTSLALLAGAEAQNLTEWQYGLSSVSPKWNVSGSYMQVLPEFISVNANGQKHYFLREYFKDPYEALNKIFLKGYEWPFDSKKVQNGSSIIDLLVYRETALRKRKVFLDFRQNPFGLTEIDFKKLSTDAYNYLKKAEICFGAPIERLCKMNMPAYTLYKDKGVNLAEKSLEIALCAQHHNGGIAVDKWWQTGVKGLFAAGECAGTHGITRPGGSALNSGQVGSFRAAMYISENKKASLPDNEFKILLADCIKRNPYTEGEGGDYAALTQNAQRHMSECAAAIRNKAVMKEHLENIKNILNTLGKNPPAKAGLWDFYKLRDVLVTESALLTAMLDYAEKADGSRGSALYTDENGTAPEGLEDVFKFTLSVDGMKNKIQLTTLSKDGFACRFRGTRPIPNDDDFFENVWRTYRENKNVY